MKRFISLILVIFLLFNIAGCKSEESSIDFDEINKNELSSISPTSGGSISMPILSYESLNPLYPNNSSVFYFSNLIYDSLFIYNEEGRLEPNMVEHYVLSPDKLTLTITLKDGIYWHDGSKMTADDVISTFNFLVNSEIKSPYYNLFKLCVGTGRPFDPESFVTMEKFDERNIDLHFSEPYADYLNMLTFPILQSKVLKNTDMKFVKPEDLIGTGPYKVKDIREGIHVELERYESYHGKLPYITNILAKIYDDNSLSALAFETGQINIHLSKDYDWSKYHDNSRIRIEEFSTNEMDLLVINNRNPVFRGDSGKKIKQAIARTINKKRIIDRLYLGKAIETSLPININTMHYYNLKSDTYYNEEMAKEALKEIGYTEMNESGFLVNSAGESINIELKTNFSNDKKRIAGDFIVQDLRAIGINAYYNYELEQSQTMSASQIENENNKFVSDLQNGNFDIALISINLTDVSDMGILLHTNAIGSGMNYGYYSNPNLDYYMDKIKLNNEYDLNRENYISAMEIFSNDMPVVPLYIKNSAVLIDDKIQGDINPIGSDIYRSFKNVFILKQFQ